MDSEKVVELVFVTNWPVLEAMPVEVARPISEDTEELSMLFAVYDRDEFYAWCDNATTVDTVWPTRDELVREN